MEDGEIVLVTEVKEDYEYGGGFAMFGGYTIEHHFNAYSESRRHHINGFSFNQLHKSVHYNDPKNILGMYLQWSDEKNAFITVKEANVNESLDIIQHKRKIKIDILS